MSWVKKNLLTIIIVSSVMLGIVVGVIIRIGFNISISPTNAEYVGFPGTLLIRSLKLTATPLIVSCILVALGTMNTKIIALGWQILLYVFASKFITVGVSILMTIVVAPGERGTVEKPANTKVGEPSVLHDMFLDLFRNIIPDNIVGMHVNQYHTKLESKDTSDLYAWRPVPGNLNSMNLLGLIFITIVFGFVLSSLKTKGTEFLVLMKSVFRISMVLITTIMWVAPFPLFTLILAEILKISDFSVYASTWGIFLMTVLLCHCIMLIVILPLYLFAFARCNPFKFYGDIVQAIVYAIATASSIVSMPLLLKGLKKNGVDERLTNFVIPILININKDGTAAFLAVGVVSIAQMLGEHLTIGSYISILILCVMGSMATAAVPFAGLVIIIMILNGFGMDQSLAATIMALYWIIDRGNTTVNVVSNAVATKILYTYNKKLLASLDRMEDVNK